MTAGHRQGLKARDMCVTKVRTKPVRHRHANVEAAAAASTKYVTTAKLNVRSAPSRDGDILATLNVGVTVDYTGEHDSTWSIINYNGGQAYVATAYIKPAQ